MIKAIGFIILIFDIKNTKVIKIENSISGGL